MNITRSLRAALAELYFREECAQKGWAFAHVPEIHAQARQFAETGTLDFGSGAGRVRARLVSQLIPEIARFCTPAEGGFLFDFLAFMSAPATTGPPVVANPSALSWVLVRPGPFSERQREALPQIRLPLTRYKIRDVLAPPGKIESRWDTRTGTQWLDMLDDQRDQAESDDEYL